MLKVHQDKDVKAELTHYLRVSAIWMETVRCESEPSGKVWSKDRLGTQSLRTAPFIRGKGQ